MAENILAAACESETRKAAKRMRLEIYQSSQVPARCQLWPGWLCSHSVDPVARVRVQGGQSSDRGLEP